MPASTAGPSGGVPRWSWGSPDFKMVGHLVFGPKKSVASPAMALDSDEDLGEGDRHETVEGAAALLDARPQQGALIGIEKKGSQVRGRRLGRDRAVGLGFGDDRGNVRRPGRIKVGQACTDQLALI